MMKQRIKIADLPEFDATEYLDNEDAIAICLADILDANHGELIATAFTNIKTISRKPVTVCTE